MYKNKAPLEPVSIENNVCRWILDIGYTVPVNMYIQFADQAAGELLGNFNPVSFKSAWNLWCKWGVNKRPGS